VSEVRKYTIRVSLGSDPDLTPSSVLWEQARAIAEEQGFPEPRGYVSREMYFRRWYAEWRYEA
jgi:hypothetical protein